MIKKKKKYNAVILLICLVLLGGVSFFPVSEKYGVDFKYYRRSMPLFEKASNFLSRNFFYKRIADEAAADVTNEKDIAVALLKWINANIYSGVPEGLQVRDDHVSNIIVRGYGTDDQLADAFSTLCIYKRIKASMYKVTALSGYQRIMAVAKINGKWTVIDPFKGIYFTDRHGGLAGISDIAAGDFSACSVSGKKYTNTEYLSLLKEVKPFDEPQAVRAQLQLPLFRLCYEIRKIAGLAKKPPLFLG